MKTNEPWLDNFDYELYKEEGLVWLHCGVSEDIPECELYDEEGYWQEEIEENDDIMFW